MESMENQEQPKKNKPKPGSYFKFIPREVQQWIKQNSTNSHVNNWKRGGGNPTKTGTK